MRHVVCLIVVGMAAVPGLGQSGSARPSFDVASIKVSTNCAGGRGGGMPTPGTLHVVCFSAQEFIGSAYNLFADGVSQNPVRMQITGGPAWMQSDTYDIDAKAANAPIARMYGPMLQVLLEDRFKLKIHKETREAPVYTLTVAKGGSKLQPMKEGSCVVIDLNHLPEPGAARSVPNCGSGSSNGNAVSATFTTHGATIGEMIARSFAMLDRPVIDKTGLTGRFDVHLEYARENAAPGDTSAPSIFTAVQDQLGLKLTPDKGPVEVLVIDHIERPSEN